MATSKRTALLALAFASVLVSVFVSGPLPSAHALMEPITLTSEHPATAVRFAYGIGEMPKGESSLAVMAAVKRAQLEGDFETCVKKAESAFAKSKPVQAWIASVWLDCASRLKPSAASGERVHHVLAQVDKNPAWMVRGPQSAAVRLSYIRAALSVLESDAKFNRARGSVLIERLQELGTYLDDAGRATLYRWAGEIAIAERKTEAAREFLQRSLAANDSNETRARLTAIESTLPAEKAEKNGPKNDQKNEPVSPRAAPEIKTALDAGKEELELVDRVTSLLKSGELVAAVDDAVKLIRAFPGGTRAKWAFDRVSEAYWSIAEKTESRYQLIHSQMIRAMEKADGDRLADWARTMYSRGQWEDALALSRRSLESVTGARSTAVLDLAAKSALACDQFDQARELLDRLVREHAGAKEAREALFRSGLLHYRRGEFAQSAADLERLLALPQTGLLELGARYWLWRALQRTQTVSGDRTIAVSDELRRKFPFSYYGLRVRLERTGGALEWKPETSKLTTKLWLTDAEKKSFDRSEILAKAGWLEEAQAELRELPLPQDAEDKAVRALVWAAAGQFTQAAKLANEAWDEKPELRRPPFVNAAFPQEFTQAIEAQSVSRKLDSYVVRSLIKQESGFNVRAVSSSGAMGLMQMIPATAREIAQDLRLGSLNLPEDVFQPQRNIQMGTYYFARMLSKYQGSVPLALAAYNAGPARIDRWLRSRASLKNVIINRSSAPDEELWFDEIPYLETSVYVKSILRNMLIYRMLDESRVQVREPIWSQSSPQTNP